MTTLTKREAPSSALSVANGQDFWNANQLAALRQIGVEGATNGDLAVFLNYAQRTGLDPFARQIYMIGRNDRRSGTTKWTIQASIDGLRIVAQRSGEYAGQVGPEWCGTDGVWKDVWLGPGAPAAARVGVLRRGFSEPLWAVALTAEYAATYNDKPTGLWSSKPAAMIAKCAEALALRKAFPMDLSGIYTEEEAHVLADEGDADDATFPAATPEKYRDTGAAAEAPSAHSEAPVSTGRDWVREIDNASDTDTLRALYNEAKAAGAPGNLADLIAARAQALAAAEEVVDAEIVEPPVDAEADAAWMAGQPA